MAVKKLLHVGCGPKGAPVAREFAAYREVRLDANPNVAPDVVASIVAMPMVEDESYDGAYASHVLEHLHYHEIAMAMKELLRVLKPGGLLKVHVPDLQAIGSAIALDKPEGLAYQGPAGPIAPLDMLFGHRGMIAKGNHYMAHKMGFTASVLKNMLMDAGFAKVETNRDTKFELVALATKEQEHAGEIGESEALSLRDEGGSLGQEAPLRHEGAVA